MQVVYDVTERNLVLNDQNWTIHYYKQWDDYLFAQDKFLEQKIAMVAGFVDKNGPEMEFRLSVEIKTLKYLLGVYPTDRKIYIGGHQLSNEMTLIRMLQNNHSNEVLFESLKAHVNKIAAIPVENTPAVIDLVSYEFDLTNMQDKSYDEVQERSVELKKQLVQNVGRK